VAGGAEAAPERVTHRLLYRADLLPLGLQLAHRAQRLLVVRLVGQRLGLLAQTLLPGLVRPALGALLGQGALARVEEAVAGGAETLPGGVALGAPGGPDLAPFGLQRLQAVGGLAPLARSGQRLGLLA